MKKFFEEFKTFALRGNVVDMAVGVVIGGAFSAIVNSLVSDIISPLIGLLFRDDFSALTAEFGGITLAYGAFLTAVINFVIVAFALFLVIKALNSANRMIRRKKEEEAAAPTTKTCPFCKSSIAIDASRCPHCTSMIEE